MNYCSINDAWGQNNYISNQYKKFDNQYKPQTQSQPTKKIQNKIKKKPIEKFTNHKKHFTNCSSFFNHLKTCKKCNHRMREQFKSKILENFEDIIQNNRDIIVLILVGLCFMIFFNMIMHITSK